MPELRDHERLLLSRIRLLAAAAPVALAGLVMAACASSQPGASSAATARPARSTTPATSTTTGLEGYVTGYGATIASWGNSHTADPDGTGFWPRLDDGDDTYASLTTSAGRVVGYTQNFDPPSSPADARASVMNEFPTDAKITADVPGASCEQLVVSSPTVRELTGTEVIAKLYGPAPGQVDRVTYAPLAVGRGAPRLPEAC